MQRQNCTDTIFPPRIVARQSRPDRGSSVVRRIKRDLRHFSDIVSEWRRRRRSRLYLAHMSDRELHDLGLSRIDADQEALQPFWRFTAKR